MLLLRYKIVEYPRKYSISFSLKQFKISSGIPNKHTGTVLEKRVAKLFLSSFRAVLEKTTSVLSS